VLKYTHCAVMSALDR